MTNLNNPVILGLIGVGVLALVNLGLLFWVWKKFAGYQNKQDRLLDGEEAGNLETAILKNQRRLKNHQQNLKELGDILSEIVEKNKFNIQQVGLVRYNPFEDTGSNMSFALALLDGNSDGIVMSSLHSREGTRIYSKDIESGRSKSNLTEEEEEAIRMAVDSRQ